MPALPTVGQSSYDDFVQNTDALTNLYGAEPLAAVTTGVIYGVTSVLASVGELTADVVDVVSPTAGNAIREYKPDPARTIDAVVSDSWSQFYGRNAGGINLGADVASLFLGGSAGLKMLNGVKKGKWATEWAGNPYAKAEKNRMTWLEKARAGEAALGNYTPIRQAALKSLGYGVAEAGVESVALTAFAFATMNESDLFQDYEAQDFVVDTLLGGAIGTLGRALTSRRAYTDGVANFEKRFNEKNGFVVPGADADLAGGIFSMAESRAGKTFGDAASQKRFDAEVMDFVKRTSPESSDSVLKLLPNINKLAQEGKTAGLSELLSGLKNARAVGQQESRLIANSQLKTLVDDGVLIPVSDASQTLRIQFDTSVKGINKAELVGQNVKLALNKELSENLLSQLDSSLDDVLENDGMIEISGAQLFRNKSTGELVYTPGGRGLEKVKVANLTGVEAASQRGAQVTTYFDTQRGVNLNGIVPTAGDFGAKFLGTRVQMGTRAYDAVKLIKRVGDVLKPARLTRLRPEDADALNIMATQAGRDAKLATKLFNTIELGFSEARTSGLDFNPGNFAGNLAVFPGENVYALMAAAEAAQANGGKALVRIGKQITALDGLEIGKQLRMANQTRVNKLAEFGMGLDEIERRTGVVLNGDQVTQANIYAGRKLEDALSPRHVALDYDITGFPTRQEALAAMDVRAYNDLRREFAANTAALSIGDMANIDDIVELTKGFTPKSTTSQSQVAGAVSFSGGGKILSPERIADQLGSLRAVAKDTLKQRFATQFTDAVRPLFTGPVTSLANFNFAYNKLAASKVIYNMTRDADGRLRFFNPKTDEVLDAPMDEKTEAVFEKLFGEGGLHRESVRRYNARARAIGGKELDENLVYVPQMRGQYFLQVEAGGGVSYVNAATEAALEQLRGIVSSNVPNAVIKTRAELGALKRSEGKYDSSLDFNSVELDIELRRAGGPMVETVAIDDRYIRNMADFYDRQAASLVDWNMDAILAEEISTLGQMQRTYDGAKTSIKGALTRFTRKDAKFQDIIATMQNRALKSGIPILDAANDNVTAFFSEAYGAVANFIRSDGTSKLFANDARVAAAAGAELNALNASYKTGFTVDYRNLAENIGLMRKDDLQFAQNAVNGFNGFFATMQLGVDALNTVVNTLSFVAGTLPEIKNIQRELTANMMLVPGTKITNYSYTKSLASTMRKMSDSKLRGEMLTKWKSKGIIIPEYGEFLESRAELEGLFGAYTAAESGNKLLVAKEALRTGYTKTATKFKDVLLTQTNEFLRLAAAELADDVFKASKIPEGPLRDAQVANFVKRTLHAFPYAQRPAIMQGPIGSAISLYQTYVFNTIQNMTRYIGDGDSTAIKAFLTAQAGTFGLQSNPVFQAVNARIVQRDGNTDRQSLYTGAQDPVGDWLLYGPASAAMQVNLFTRGDLTPRNALILPTEVAQIPFVANSIKAAQSIYEFGGKVYNGAPIPRAFGEAVMQSGLSRPLTGIAAILTGSTVDSQNQKVSDVEALDMSSLLRIAGGRPLQEAKMLEQRAKAQALQAWERDRVKDFTRTLRTKIRAGEEPTAQEFEEAQASYVRAGGDAENFADHMKRTMVSANRELADRLGNKFQNDPKFEYIVKNVERESGRSFDAPLDGAMPVE